MKTSLPDQSAPNLERPNDKWLRLLIIPLAVLLSNLLYVEEFSFGWLVYAVWSVIGIGYILLVWELCMQWLLFVRRRLTAIQQTQKRVLFTFVGLLAITAFCQFFIIWTTDKTHLNSVPINGSIYLRMVSISVFWVMLIGAVFEFQYYLSRYREAVQESVAIKKAVLQSQYDSLKNQVNPHFLFNALNSLSALIGEDRKRASEFLDELSSVYRYLLQAGQRPLVTLAEEMSFLHAYRHLLDVRFGAALRWNIHVSDHLLDQYLPPFTLQTLLENALRFNTLLADQPLTLSILTQPDGTLLVSNTIQRKKAAVLSPQGGLTLLAARYESLKLGAPVIEDDGQQFTVRLPLTCKDNSFAHVPNPNMAT